MITIIYTRHVTKYEYYISDIILIMCLNAGNQIKILRI